MGTWERVVCCGEGSQEVVVVDNRERAAVTGKLVAGSVERVVDSYKVAVGVGEWEEPWEWAVCGGEIAGF